jgi:dihydroorotate dehydrogenase (NAD+) catalytic subunit
MANHPENRANDLESSALPRYDWSKSYDWNYEHAPDPISCEEPPVPGAWNYCGLPVYSPLGIAAGPLLNGRWILYYASLGFDVLTYKTVRSRQRDCYPLPNLQPVTATRISGPGEVLPANAEMRGSWAVSFGMPSKSPDIWRADIAATRRPLAKNKILAVSVVATPEPDWTLDDIAMDFAQCAKWAVESGADCIEANFSCPNVSSADGQLYHQPAAAEVVAARLRNAVGSKPLLIKIGHVPDETAANRLSKALAPHADALVMINCIGAKVLDKHNRPLFNGECRGISGEAIRDAVLAQVSLFKRVINQLSLKLQIVGVGGINSAQDVRAHLEAGSHTVQLAAAAMVDPAVSLKIRRLLS